VCLLTPRIVGIPETSPSLDSSGVLVSADRKSNPGSVESLNGLMGNLRERIPYDGIQPIYGGNGNAGIVAGRAYEYRLRAQQCLELARTFGDRGTRASLTHMAHAWLRLADIAAPEQKRPVQQQQQQTHPKRD
jgi:hypothetical protein